MFDNITNQTGNNLSGYSAVAAQALGRWPQIIAQLGVASEHLSGKHGPCPGCGGRDRFRFDDRGGRGTWVCGGGGEQRAGDGFALLQHVRGWSASEALERVRELTPGNHASLPPVQPPRPAQTPSKTASYARALWQRAERDDSAVAAHPYAQAKRIKWAAGAGRVRASGKLIGSNADCIIVPVRSLDTGQLIACECISAIPDPSGKHPRQSFGPKGDGALLLGNWANHSLERHVVEGWATAARHWQMLGDVVVAVAFGAGRLAKVGAWLEANMPGGRVYLAKEAANG